MNSGTADTLARSAEVKDLDTLATYSVPAELAAPGHSHWQVAAPSAKGLPHGLAPEVSGERPGTFGVSGGALTETVAGSRRQLSWTEGHAVRARFLPQGRRAA